MFQILVQKNRFKHVLRRIYQGKCVLNLNETDVRPENFFDPFLCPEKILVMS
jgi:lauroyl/myristoyl acyltransferase